MEGSWRWFRDVVGLPGKGCFLLPTWGNAMPLRRSARNCGEITRATTGFAPLATHEDEALKTRIETLIRKCTNESIQPILTSPLPLH